MGLDIIDLPTFTIEIHYIHVGKQISHSHWPFLGFSNEHVLVRRSCYWRKLLPWVVGSTWIWRSSENPVLGFAVLLMHRQAGEACWYVELFIDFLCFQLSWLFFHMSINRLIHQRFFNRKYSFRAKSVFSESILAQIYVKLFFSRWGLLFS